MEGCIELNQILCPCRKIIRYNITILHKIDIKEGRPVIKRTITYPRVNPNFDTKPTIYDFAKPNPKIQE